MVLPLSFRSHNLFLYQPSLCPLVVATKAAPFLAFYRQQAIRLTTHLKCQRLARKSRDIDGLCLTSARTPDLVIIVRLLVRLTTSLTPAILLLHTPRLKQSRRQILYPASSRGCTAFVSRRDSLMP